MRSMENVIKYIINSMMKSAVIEFSGLTGCGESDAQKAVQALRPYLDPSYQKIAEASPESPESGLDPMSALITPDDFKGFPEAIAEDTSGYASSKPTEAKPQIDKWIVTAIHPDKTDWFCVFTDIPSALDNAQDICACNYTNVSISRVIAEAKATTTWSIEL